MAQITVKSFAAQIGIPSAKLLQQLVAAGIHDKKSEDVLSDEEKMVLLSFLRTHHGAEGAATKKVVLKQKSTSQITQSSRFGQARTVQVEVRKKRTFVKQIRHALKRPRTRANKPDQ
jgi:translation initiation factor IF-2